MKNIIYHGVHHCLGRYPSRFERDKGKNSGMKNIIYHRVHHCLRRYPSRSERDKGKKSGMKNIIPLGVHIDLGVHSETDNISHSTKL